MHRTRLASMALALLVGATLPLRASHAVQPATGGSSSTSAEPVHGPLTGSLVIAGGGNLAGTGIMERFIALAGGPDAKIVIVPTAGGNRRPDGALIPYDTERVLAPWKRLGLINVHMLHTHDPQRANTPAFAAVLDGARGVWFNGGRQWNLVDSYSGTRTFRGFHDVLTRGGVIGGSSAGATIQGTYLVRGAISGSEVMMAPEPEHQEAFNFLRRSAIDQHVDARNRWDDLIPVMDRFPDYLGLGISESTALVVRRDTFEVIGKGAVAVHDRSPRNGASGKAFQKLWPGARYHMGQRVLLTQGQAQPATPGPRSQRMW